VFSNQLEGAYTVPVLPAGDVHAGNLATKVVVLAGETLLTSTDAGSFDVTITGHYEP